MTELNAAPRPCNTCPYRRDTPAGVWHPDEYVKLATYDQGGGGFVDRRIGHNTRTGSAP